MFSIFLLHLFSFAKGLRFTNAEFFYTFAQLNRPFWADLPVQRQRLPCAFKMRKGVKIRSMTMDTT